MQVLFLLAEHLALTVKEVAAHLEMPPSTSYRYLSSLKSSGMVWERQDSKYTLGPRSVQLETAFRKCFERSSYHPIMRDIAQQTGETVALLVPVDKVAVCIDTIESARHLRYTFSKGVAKPMLRGASAKAMLPFLPPEWVEQLIDSSGDLCEDEKGALRNEMPVIREQGYAVSYGEVDEGVWAVGAPVFKLNGALEASLSVIGPGFRIRGAEEKLIQLTLVAARRMSNIEGWELDDVV